MDNSLARYDAYKDSGVEWLGEIPAEWEVVPLRALLLFRNEKNEPVITENILSLSIANGVTQYSDKNRGGNKRKDDLTAYKIARPNDIVLNSMNVIVGAVGISKFFGAISPVYYALFSKEGANIDYYNWFFQNQVFQRNLLKLGKGILIKHGDAGKMNTIRMKVSKDDLSTHPLPKPPIKTQAAIANYLDDKTAKIDQAISLKTQLIERLKERKQILIQNAVTKGLNPDVPFKDSGVEWIGDIPSHWEVKRLATLGTFSKGGGFSKSDLQKAGVKAILYGDIYTRYEFEITNSTRFVSEECAEKAIKIDKGDLLFTGSGETIEDIGKCVHFNCSDKYVVGGDVIIMNKVRCSSSFLSFVMNTEGAKSEKAKTAKGQIIVHTYASKIKNIYLPIPSAEEQKEICVFLKTQSKKIDTAITQQQTQIERLKEYKATLIDSAVTGKIKVC